MSFIRILGLTFASVGIINAQRIDLGTALPFAVLGGETVTNTGHSSLTFDLGVSPGEAITGFDPGTVTRETHRADEVAAKAQLDVVEAYNDAASRPSTPVSEELGGTTLVGGVYSFSTSAVLTGTVTLDGQGDPDSVWVFQVGSTLTTEFASTVQLTNGALACNVFWQVGSSATIGSETMFVGSILALASITVDTGATVSGGLYARNGAVSLENNIVTHDQCLASPSSSPSAAPSNASSTVASSVPPSSSPSISASSVISSAISSQASSVGSIISSSASSASSAVSSSPSSSSGASITASSAISSAASSVVSSVASSMVSSVVSSAVSSAVSSISSASLSSSAASSSIVSSTAASSSVYAVSSATSSSSCTTSQISSSTSSSLSYSTYSAQSSSTKSSTTTCTTSSITSIPTPYDTSSITSSITSSTTTCTTSTSTKSFETYVHTDNTYTKPETTACSCTTFITVRPHYDTAIPVYPPAKSETETASASFTAKVVAITTGLPTPKKDHDAAYTPEEAYSGGHNTPSYIPTAKNTTATTTPYIVTAGAAVVPMRWLGGATVAFLAAILALDG